jgi:hypothetical protein
VVKASDLLPILLANSTPATSPSGGVASPNNAPGAASCLIAVSTPDATGARSISIVSISTAGGTINLPDVASPSVVEIFGTVAAANVFHVTDLSDTSSVEMDLQTVPETVPSSDQLAVSSASGKPLDVPTPTYSMTTESLTVLTTQVPEPGAGFFVKVNFSTRAANDPAPSPGPQSSDFLLSITRQDLAPTAPSGPTLGSSPTGPSPHPPTAPPAPGPATPPPSSFPVLERLPDPPPTSDSASAVGARVVVVPGAQPGPLANPPPVSTGPLPMRSAAALGGVLATGDPVPQVDRADAVVIDLALTGLIPEEPVGPEEEGPAASSGRLAEVRGPGGFPLLASAPSRSLAAPPTDAPWAALPRSPEANRPPPAGRPAPAVSSTGPAARSHRSAGSGLTFALSLVFGLVLPDLADAFRRDPPPPGPPRPSRRRG